MSLSQSDPAAHALLNSEVHFRRRVLDLVPSDNHPSPAVREALTYPLFYSENDGRNYYYPACETVAKVETLAKERALALFAGSEHVNVKPTDGTRGNEAVYRAVLKEGEKILSLGLADGGHLSHGLRWNYSGQLYEIAHYGVTPSGHLDMDAVRAAAKRESPRLIIAGGSSCPFQFDFEAFAGIAREVGAMLHADISHFAGLVVTGHHPSPFPHADTVMTTLQKTLRGAKGAIAFSRTSTGADLDRAVFPGVLAHATGAQLLAKAVCLGEAATPEFAAYAEGVVQCATRLAEELSDRGYDLVTGGTQTHLMILDLRSKGLSGRDAEKRLQGCGLLANKQLVPQDPQKPTVCSGVRIGTPCLVSRGFGVGDMPQVGAWIHRALSGENPEGVLREVEEAARLHEIP